MNSWRLAITTTVFVAAASLPAASGAHAAEGTPVDNLQMSTSAGDTTALLAARQTNVLVFVRAAHERSTRALRELAACKAAFAGKPVQWVAIVPDPEAASAIADDMREARFDATVLIDKGNELHGRLGVVQHPAAAIVGRDQKLAAFEPYRSIDYCAIVQARVRQTLGEAPDAQGREVSDPPPASVGDAASQAARRYRALAEALLRAGNHDKALESARRSLEKDDQAADTHALVGRILLAQGRCSEAAQSFDKGVALGGYKAAAQEALAGCKPAR